MTEKDNWGRNGAKGTSVRVGGAGSLESRQINQEEAENDRKNGKSNKEK